MGGRQSGRFQFGDVMSVYLDHFLVLSRQEQVLELIDYMLSGRQRYLEPGVAYELCRRALQAQHPTFLQVDEYALDTGNPTPWMRNQFDLFLAAGLESHWLEVTPVFQEVVPLPLNSSPPLSHPLGGPLEHVRVD